MPAQEGKKNTVQGRALPLQTSSSPETAANIQQALCPPHPSCFCSPLSPPSELVQGVALSTSAVTPFLSHFRSFASSSSPKQKRDYLMPSTVLTPQCTNHSKLHLPPPSKVSRPCFMLRPDGSTLMSRNMCSHDINWIWFYRPAN